MSKRNSPRAVREHMARCTFRRGQRNAKGITPIYFKDGGRVVGYICEMWGKDAGWFWRPCGWEWSDLPCKTAREAILAIGETL